MDAAAFKPHTLSELDSSAPPAPSLRGVRIDVVDADGKRTGVAFASGTVVIGSSEVCDLIVPDLHVSRRHCSVELLGSAVRVRDLGSRNGTRYLGARITEATVPVGGTIVIGTTTLQFATAEKGGELSEHTELEGLLGRSPSMRRVFKVLERVGPTEATALIRGETGTGKDAIARALHALSPRAKGPFVVFDCGSTNSELIEADLFGHEKGAFTGAASARAGALEVANGGTLFFDEVGELPADLQPRLLRAIETREFRRVGGDDVRKTDVRILAATHRDLEVDVQAGRFRADLFFRLAVAMVEVPPLRERGEDIPLLAEHFARLRCGANVQIDPSMLAELQCNPWPGNVRELRNEVERQVVLGSWRRQLVETGPDEASFKAGRQWLLDQYEKDYLGGLLERHCGNISAVARASGLSRSQLYRVLRRHRLLDTDEKSLSAGPALAAGARNR